MALAFLNKKAWHTGTMQNIEKVWEREEAKKQEEKKLKEFQKQLAEERQVLELKRMQEQAGIAPKRSERLDWMYQGPVVHEPTADDFLMGKKWTNKAEKDDIVETNKNNVIGANFLPSSSSGTPKTDAFTIKTEDPMFAIKRDEQKAREAVLNNPFQLKRARELAMAKAHSKKLKKALKKEKKREKKEKKKEKKERKRDSHRSDDEDHRRSHGRGRSRSRSRSRSHRRSRSPLRRARASSSPRRHRRRSPSPRRVDRHRSPPVRRGDVRSRSPRRSTQRHARPSKQSAEEREAKLREMMQAAEEHQKDRRERILRGKEIESREGNIDGSENRAPEFIRDMKTSATGMSMEERIRSRRHFQQRKTATEFYR